MKHRVQRLPKMNSKMFESIFKFSCPVCGCMLEKDGGTLRCVNGHCFDIAKQGYVNLLQSQKSSSKRHGDDKLMVKSRSDFLDKRYYDSLVDRIISMIGGVASHEMLLVDLGCGECFYTAKVQNLFTNIALGGIDISKQALIAGSKRSKCLSLAVASVFELPVADDYCDMAMTIFAPHSVSEICRILHKGGFWLRAYPLEKHLMGLKSVIYEKPYLNDVDRSIPDGFVIKEHDEIKEKIIVNDNNDIVNLFRMTPYYYKTGKTDQEKLLKIETLETEIEFGIDLLRKA